MNMKEFLTKSIMLLFDAIVMLVAFVLLAPRIYEMALKEINDPSFTVIFCLGIMFIFYKFWVGITKITVDLGKDTEEKEVIKENRKKYISWMKERNEDTKKVEEKSREKSQTTY